MKITEIFPNVNHNNLQQARWWLLLGLFSLMASGLIAILVVLPRMPVIQDFIPAIKDSFKIALVLHVNLSVLFWFMAFSSMFWSLASEGKLHRLAQAGFWISVLGTLILIVAPFIGVGNPILNNYIPTLDHPVFFASLLLFCFGVCIRILVSILSTRIFYSGIDVGRAIRMSIFLCCFVVTLTIWALWKSYVGLTESNLEGEAYFEFLYWGSGHVLQFNHSLLVLMAWLILLLGIGKQVSLDGKWIFLMAVLSVLPAFWAIKIYSDFDIYTPEHRQAFTELMKFGGLTTLPLGLYIAWVFFFGTINSPKNKTSHLKAALICSVALFLAGGVIGFLIEGVNVVIPAHYHGSVVGITIAFMGISYLLLPILGYGIPNIKLATIQLYVSGIGQLMHVFGLAFSGSHGVQRKAAGAEQGLDKIEQVIGMALMGVGGILGIGVGGVMFLVLMIIAIRNPQQNFNESEG